MTVPEKFYSEEWLKREFPIPRAKADRVALRLDLETASRMGRMFLPENQRIRKIILDRLQQIEDFEKIIAPTV